MGQPEEGSHAPTPEDERVSLSGLTLSPWVEERARVQRELHYAQRRGESVKNTRSKVSKWRSKDEGG